jgi:hypothetical protein
MEYRLPVGKFIPEAAMLYKFYLVEMEIPHKTIDGIPYIPLWLLLKDPESLDLLTSHASVVTGMYIKKNVDLVTGSRIDLYCDDYFNTDSIVLESKQNRVYPPKLLRDMMLSMAFFDLEVEREESCDWLCGKARSWRLRKLSSHELNEYSRIYTEWRDLLSDFIDGRSQTDPGHFAYFFKNRLSDRSPY